MRKVLFAALAGLPVLVGAGAASAASIKEDFGGSMYQSQSPLPNALENAAPGVATPRVFAGRAAFVYPQAYYNALPDPQPPLRAYAQPLVGRDWRPGDNF